MNSSDTKYDPKKYEPQIYTKWQESGAFSPRQDASGKPFVIMLPPPNITGSLHMGHALQDTIIDVLVRYHRMKGETVVWIPGTDHAALPTNKILENQLRDEGTTKEAIGRDAFLKRAEEWYEKTGNIIVDQMKQLGVSADWSRSRFTLDEKYIQAVNEAFIQYYKKGYIYRGHRIVNWDPMTQTTVSDLEIDWKTEKVPFYTFKYGEFEISTARPETKFGDKYVVMHPHDARYAQYKQGDTFECEWINGPVTATVIKDEAIDPSFGTGVMTITPWHDTTDFEIAERHDLPMEPIIGLDGRLLPIAGEFAGLTIIEARPQIIEKMKAKGLLVRVDENYEHNVALNDRGKGMIEPHVMRQWFVDMSKLSAETIGVAEKDLVTFIPERWKEHFIDWMKNIRDWNINRQIWLGHRIPVWWKEETRGTDHEEGNFVISLNKPEGKYEQDPDVLDTWFSSALWPFATLGWPDNTKDLQQFYPTSVLVTGRDILYLWVARMVFSGLELLKGENYGNRSMDQRLPFEKVFIHPTVLTKDGKRMSKSLGTGVDPLDLINTYGADATRFGLLYQLHYDQQAIRFDEEAIKATRNFTTKIWNMWQLLKSLERSEEEKTIADQWIVERTQEVSNEVAQLIETFHVGEASRVLQDFMWKEYADWYLEIVKVKGSVSTARVAFQQILHMLHPFMPFMTEVIWHEMEQSTLLMTSQWPQESITTDQKIFSYIRYFQDVVTTLRRARAMLGLKPALPLIVHLDKPVDESLHDALLKLGRVEIHADDTAVVAVVVIPTGERISIVSSDTVKEEHVFKAQQLLQDEHVVVSEQIKAQHDILERMQKHGADVKKQAEKQATVDTLQARLTEIETSQKLWTNRPTDK